MAKNNTVTNPTSGVLAIRLGKNAVNQLIRIAERESVKTISKITVSDLIKKALTNSYPDFFPESSYD